MSDDVFNIPTPFADIAALGQGYAMRADGEYLWVPLPQPVEVGMSVQFIVTLQDGTPAFAGLGQCVQVSDTGEEAHPQLRFETALGALQFDERSQPVYDYLVAVRAAAIEAQQAEGGAEAAPEEETAANEATVDGTEVQHVTTGEVHDAAAAYAEEAAYADEAEAQGEPEMSYAEAPENADGAPEAEVGYEQAEAQVATYDDADGAEELVAEQPVGEMPYADGPVEITPSVIPTGMLKRPAIALGWKPAPPRPPQPHQGSGLFQYAQGALPIPETPPRPDLDPSYWVQPAPRPGSQVAAAASEAVAADEFEMSATELGDEGQAFDEAPAAVAVAAAATDGEDLAETAAHEDVVAAEPAAQEDVVAAEPAADEDVVAAEPAAHEDVAIDYDEQSAEDGFESGDDTDPGSAPMDASTEVPTEDAAEGVERGSQEFPTDETSYASGEGELDVEVQ